MASNSVEIYTDGGYSIDKGKGAWAIVVTQNGEIIEEHRKEVVNSTSQRMELMAFISALSYTSKYDSVEIYSDSKYTLDGYNSWMLKWQRNGWKRGKSGVVKNLDLWKEILKLKSDKVKTFKVKAHSGNKFNERADALCKTGEDYKELEPISRIYLKDKGWEEGKNSTLVKKDCFNKIFYVSLDGNSNIVLEKYDEFSFVLEYSFEGNIENIREFNKLLSIFKFQEK